MITLPLDSAWFHLPVWMDDLNSGVGPAELFFSGLAAAVITVAVYTPWILRQKRASKKDN